LGLTVKRLKCADLPVNFYSVSSQTLRPVASGMVVPALNWVRFWQVVFSTTKLFGRQMWPAGSSLQVAIPASQA
jgi:hypothetical protein